LKNCSKCNQLYPTDFFSRKLCTYDGLQPHCKLCNSLQNKKWYDTNKHRKRAPSKEQKQKLKLKKISKSTLFLKLKWEAKTRGYECDLTYKRYLHLVKSPCFYCGDTLSFRGHGIDRPDNTMGYVDGNYVPCCSICNRMKSVYHHKHFFEHINKIAKNLKSKESLWQKSKSSDNQGFQFPLKR
jgi:hypothetical protein